MKRKFKILELVADQFKEYDVVINEDQEETYTIIGLGTTLIHGHKWVKVRFDGGIIKNFMISDFYGKRLVLRLDFN